MSSGRGSGAEPIRVVLSCLACQYDLLQNSTFPSQKLIRERFAQCPLRVGLALVLQLVWISRALWEADSVDVVCKILYSSSGFLKPIPMCIAMCTQPLELFSAGHTVPGLPEGSDFCSLLCHWMISRYFKFSLRLLQWGQSFARAKLDLKMEAGWNRN